MALLFDHLVGASEQGRRHFEAERLGRFEGSMKGLIRWLYRARDYKMPPDQK